MVEAVELVRVSMLITSRTFSTTQMVAASRAGLAQMGQSSVSLMLWHIRQYVISLRSLVIALANASTSAGSRLRE